MSNPRRANGHRRNQVRRRVLAEEDVCWLCGELVDKTLDLMPGVHSDRCANPRCTGCVPDLMRGEVDEVIPVKAGGSPIDRANCRLSHRKCNLARNRKRPPRRVPVKKFTTARSW